MRIEVLGPVRAQAEGAEIRLGGPQQRLVLSLLVAARGEVVTTDQLVDRIWGDYLPDHARKTVQVYVSTLRRALGDSGAIVSAGGGYRLAGSVETDTDDFELLAAEGHECLANRPGLALSKLMRALGLWRGPPYAELRGHDSLQHEIERLEELHQVVVEDRIAAEIATGHTAAVVPELESLVEDQPLRERPRLLLMAALYRSGRQTEALATFRDLTTRLIEEFGLDPSPQLRDLELQILQHDTALGSPLDALVSVSEPPGRYSSFVGRDADVASLGAHFEEARLVTLVGPGGIGKSSLAAEALREAYGRTDTPVAWVDVESTASGRLSLATALAMGLEPGPSAKPELVIVRYARERPFVLLFDGCEPLITEAARLTERLLTSCPKMRVVATSREPLGLAGEAIVRVGSLDRESAERLFVERANLDQLDEAATEKVGAVCAALDGIPLAIELAASRLRSMHLERLVGLLDDQVALLRRARTFDERHGSLAAALESSYRLIDADEQAALRALSVFRRDFGPSAAAAVVAEAKAASLVDRLVDVSLVQPPDESGRYRMLEPVRQYARELLTESGKTAEVRERHARWVAEQCRVVEAAELTPDVVKSREWIARNRFELAAAAEWSLDSGNPEIGIRIIASVGRRLANQGYGALLLPTAVELVEHPAAATSAEAVVAMAHTALLLSHSLDTRTALELADRAARQARLVDDPFALGTVMMRKAVLMAESQQTSPANLATALDAVAILEKVERVDPIEYFNVGLIAVALGEADLAEEYAGRGLDVERSLIGRTTGDGEAILSATRLSQGRLDEAITLIGQAARLGEAMQTLLYAGMDWATLAVFLAYAERYREAAVALERADAVAERVGVDYLDAFGPRMRVAADRGAGDEVLQVAKDWFRRIVAGGGTNDFFARDKLSVLHGDASKPSGFMSVLLPLATALMDAGDTRTACRLARSASAMMASARFAGWDAIGETDRWARLAGSCRDEPEDALTTVEEAFDLAARAVALLDTHPAEVPELAIAEDREDMGPHD